MVDAGVAGVLAISPSYRAGAQAGSKAKTLAGAIRSGASVGRRVGNYVGRSVAVASGESRQSQLTPKQRQSLEKQQELLRKARNAMGAEYESILREIDRACSAYSGIAQAKDTPTEAATVHTGVIDVAGYWDRNDGYFAGNWWHDEKKPAEAALMLKQEAGDGYISINMLNRYLSISDGRKLDTLQALTGIGNSAGGDMVALYTYLETTLNVCYDIDFNVPKGLSREHLDALVDYEKTMIGKGFGQWMDNGGREILTGFTIIAGGAYRNYVNGVYDKSLVSRIYNAQRTGSALKGDIYHRAASYLSEEQLSQGSVFYGIGNDGQSYTLLQVEGGLNNTSGVYEYIMNSEGVVTHQRYIPGGRITGFPNQ